MATWPYQRTSSPPRCTCGARSTWTMVDATRLESRTAVPGVDDDGVAGLGAVNGELNSPQRLVGRAGAPVAAGFADVPLARGAQVERRVADRGQGAARAGVIGQLQAR